VVVDVRGWGRVVRLWRLRGGNNGGTKTIKKRLRNNRSSDRANEEENVKCSVVNDDDCRKVAFLMLSRVEDDGD
jgi:hypothetical protein